MKNTGTAPLELLDVKTSCGCVAAEYAKEIPAGGEDQIHVTMETEGRHGAIVRNVTVYSNDPQSPVVPLTVKVWLRHSIEPFPGYDILFPIQRGQGQERVVTLHSFELGPLKILRVVSSAPYVQASVLPETDVPDEDNQGSRSRLKVKIAVLSNGPEAAFAQTVTVYTNSEKWPKIVLNVQGTPEGAVMVMPTHLYFGNIAAEPKEPVARSITLLTYGEPFKLLSTASTVPGLEFQVIQEQVGRFNEVIIRYKGGWKPGFVKGTLVLTTSDRMRPQIEVPFEAEVGP
jgi:hypothetical protein